MTHDGPSSEFQLSDPPKDCIQSVKFGPEDNRHLLAASWDGSVRLYDVITNKLKIQYNHDAPVLDVAFQGNSIGWSVGIDGRVKSFDFQTETETTVGYHSKPVRLVEHVSDVNLIATAGWDAQLKLWDPRQSDLDKKKPTFNHTLPDKAYAMSVCGDKLIVGTAARLINIWDLRNMTQTIRESQLKYQTRCIKSFPDKLGYVVGSIEGRVSVDYLDPSPEVQAKKYAFKCHRNKDMTTGFEIIYPVNAISFHNRFNTFATGGSDGFVSIWDGRKKKRLVQFHKYPTSISSLSFSSDGRTLAIASSFIDVSTSENTDNLRDIPPDSIYIRRVNDNEAGQKQAY